jgi:oligopeptide transport system substrate-binding protein
VRKVLNLEIDYNAIGDLRNRGAEFEAYSLMPRGRMNYSYRNLFQFDINRAKQLLAEAGYPNGKNFPQITILFIASDNLKVIDEAVQEMWRKHLHINVNLQITEWSAFLVERRRHIFDICCGNWIGDFNNVTAFRQLLLSKDNNNHAQWANGRYDRLMTEASKGKTSQEYAKFFAQTEALMMDEMPIIHIYFDSFCHLMSQRIEGWYPNVLDWHLLKDITFWK